MHGNLFNQDLFISMPLYLQIKDSIPFIEIEKEIIRKEIGQAYKDFTTN